MTWEIGDDEVHEMLALPAGDRHDHFLQLVADWEEAWGLKDDDGWIVMRQKGEPRAFPLWPHATFAEACARGPWEGAQPEAVDLDELLDTLLPMLETDGLPIAVFPTPEDEGVLLSPAELRESLEEELELGE